MSKTYEEIVFGDQKFLFEVSETNFFAEVQKEMEDEYTKNPIDPFQAEQDRTWSLLANQVVGHENL
ncbi:MAG: hypothetical protein KGJ35_01450 [Patescibacteria group bacterium]|nr:hypothetical protein [Patescibacteria group bacterium]